MISRIIVITIIAVVLPLGNVFADPIDSIQNLVTWETSGGGNGHTYALVAYRTTWDSSFTNASDLVYNGRQAYLATITSQEENDFILNNIIVDVTEQNAALEQFYIGGIYAFDSWGWISGEPFTFINWAPGEPNNVGVETVLAIWGFKPSEIDFPSGKWNNTLHDTSINSLARQWSIVEWDGPDTLKTIVIPNPIFAAMMRPVAEMFVDFYLGDFPELYTAADINISSLRINNTHLPASVVTAAHSLLNGDALKLSMPIHNFVADYYPFWGTSMKEFTISGEFTDSTPFSVTGSFNAIGHTNGDINLDGTSNSLDMLYLVNMIFRNGPAPRFPVTADVNASCSEPDLLDLLYMINFIFRQGPSPLHCAE